MASRFFWNDTLARALVTGIPQRAHRRAAAVASGVGARRIGGKGTGALARDVALPKNVGLLRSLAGSHLPYARKENDGGIIRARSSPYMLIRGPRLGARGQETRSTGTGARIVARAREVRHEGKHYLEAILATYPRVMRTELRRQLPQRRGR